MRNIFGTLLGCLVTSIGIIILRNSYLVTGGTAGLSLTLSYFFNIPFSTIFFVVNVPFYLFSLSKMGWKFTVSTLGAVTSLSLMTRIDKLIPSFTIPAFFGAVLGGFVIGIGLTIIFSHGASLGGGNIIALFLQKKYNVNPGKTNFIFDFIVVTLSFYSVGIFNGIVSILSIAITSSVISYYVEKRINKTEIQEIIEHDSVVPITL
ncbi:YitT family protein [Serpentinicella alkaliphila]|uniref:Putative 5xTM membrane YitT family protein n=1 Tax=Serpentinicella alkaliphila TaxID=1734049 RepID=A0A4R2SWT5_9FIRM|nr:YitT family protein [Serpentinicella alkaliphila]QUH27149.1 YitT family protein [Serpentinicella alkaliphila]TCP93351.1 putative 5xTM membrane YitT family protein [Serpentinicella alkaliphila]